jgi:hypothetical protein
MSASPTTETLANSPQRGPFGGKAKNRAYGGEPLLMRHPSRTLSVSTLLSAVSAL